MIILVSSTGKSKNDVMDGRFGRCPYFYILNTDSGEEKVVENEGLVSNGGAGIAASRQAIKEDAEVVITGSLGPNAFDVISMAGIKAYSSRNITVAMAIEKYRNNELQEMNTSGPSHLGMAQGGI